MGSLLYLIASCPNISFSMGACTRYQVSSKKFHLKSIKRIICYVNGTFNYGLRYPFDPFLVISIPMLIG